MDELPPDGSLLRKHFDTSGVWLSKCRRLLDDAWTWEAQARAAEASCELRSEFSAVEDLALALAKHAELLHSELERLLAAPVAVAEVVAATGVSVEVLQATASEDADAASLGSTEVEPREAPEPAAQGAPEPPVPVAPPTSGGLSLALAAIEADEAATVEPQEPPREDSDCAACEEDEHASMFYAEPEAPPAPVALEPEASEPVDEARSLGTSDDGEDRSAEDDARSRAESCPETSALVPRDSWALRRARTLGSRSASLAGRAVGLSGRTTLAGAAVTAQGLRLGATASAQGLLATYRVAAPRIAAGVWYVLSPSGLLHMGSAACALGSVSMGTLAAGCSACAVGASASSTALQTAGEICAATGSTGAIRLALRDPHYARELQQLLAAQRARRRRGLLVNAVGTWAQVVNKGVVGRLSPTLSRAATAAGSRVGRALGQDASSSTDTHRAVAHQRSYLLQSARLSLFVNQWISTTLNEQVEQLRASSDSSVESLVVVAGRTGEYWQMGWLQGPRRAYQDVIGPAFLAAASTSLSMGVAIVKRPVVATASALGWAKREDSDIVEVAMYLPCFIRCALVVREQEGRFLVDNSQLRSDADGLGYRRSPVMEDKDEAPPARFGSFVSGRRISAAWIEVKHTETEGEIRRERLLYLPSEVRGATVMVLQEGSFVLDNEELRSDADGIALRRSTTMEDKAEDLLARFGAVLAAERTGDAWLKIMVKKDARFAV